MVLHKVLRLYTTNEKFYVQPLGQESTDGKILEIDRVTSELVLHDNKGQIPPRSAESREIYGILGILNLLAGPYLVVVTKRKLVGLISGEEIWQMKEANILPFPKGTMHLTESQARDNKVFLQMAQQALQTDGFYFSYTHDLTHSQQRLQNTSTDFKQLPLYERADPRFIWNHSMLRMLAVQPELGPFTLPLMHGFVSIKKCSIKQFTFDFVLISRRSCYRAGTRYNIRGVDDEGEVANFVETEQLLFYDGSVASYVQTRGSIPLYWSQFPTIKYKPIPAIASDKDHIAAFRRHIDNQLVYYGKQVLVNLIDQKGVEKQLGERMEAASKTSGYSEIQLKYIAFDFHKECSKMRWHRLQILMDMLNDLIDQASYFAVDRNKEVLEEQSGVVRTNCMDCLDRTNVVQSLIARKILQLQLYKFGIIGKENKIVDFDEFEFIFKNIWADNADMCAHQYTGTGALKTDFTRTGKRSKYGLLQDGVNSMIRYYKNNFSDGFRQDGIDLILGNYVIDTSEKGSVFQESKGWKYMTLPFILLIGFSMLVICLLIPSTDFSLQLTYILFWAIACLITLYLVVLYGTEFVDKPRLTNRR
ncbi:phosphatidylinositol-3-phosphatase SAC1-like [Hydractinia symbiolongicarpus]|uniref:phosphatidylinositol-3-phosphatase SAC1-like n=1 Tax=Hydractinia symbiolongicarpus TaxID=13093 RepID=UPI00255007FD|nr:phosphatidylinositol-3-phosphatase SAC1-like [Hydractinia symbiolongicarpus]